MAEIAHLDSKASNSEILEIIEKDAGVILDNVLPNNFLKQMDEELSPYIDNFKKGKSEFTGYETVRVGGLLARSEACRELALNPQINQLASDFLNPFGDGYQLHFTSAVSIGPGETEQILHRDRGLWGGYIPRKIETQFSTVWALTEFTKENGATQVVPGSHKWDKDRIPQEDEIAYAEMSPGSVLLYTGTVLHGGGKNTTESDIRTGVFMHYALNWLRQEENQYLSCPPDIAKDFSPELRSLIGYSKGGYILGFYTDPYDKNGNMESVSPEKMFGKDEDVFSSLPSQTDLVKDTT
ncbi:MAG: phytanoyl-CoA dioxygenase family protein [Pseudomonadota bacterium]|nr:phytanoyl-CoA dioxygenase family protein [Pseudomonadota bacterium]